MKKVISLLLVIALFASFMVTTAFAAENASLEVTSAGTVERGDEFTLTVSIKNNPGINGGQFSITYGSDLTLTAITQGSVLNGILMPNPAAGAASYAGMSNATGDGALFTLTFKVNDDAKGGNSNVTVSVPKATTSLGPGKSETITITSGTGSVNVYVPHVCNPDLVTGSAATCTTAGTKDHYKCAECGKLYSDAAGKNAITAPESIPAKGHSYDNGVVTTEPACGVAGVKTYTCADCGDTKTESVAALNHNYVGEVTKAATCEEKGVKTYTCSLCKDSYTEELPLADHSWSDGKITKEPTCTEAGEQVGATCSVCGEVKDTVVIPAKGHSMDKGTITTPATCYKEGVLTYTCTVCGEKETEAIETLDHNWTEWNVIEATCTANGLKTRVCNNIGCDAKESEVLKATGHNTDTTKNEYKYDATQHWNMCANECGTKLNVAKHNYDQKKVIKEPTATEKGEAETYCVCGAQGPNVELPATPAVDDSPKTGDATGMITATVVTMVAMLAAAAFVFKRKAVK